MNNKAYKPTWEEIKAKYYAKFRGKNAATADDEEDGATPRKSPKSSSPPPRKSPRLRVEWCQVSTIHEVCRSVFVC